MVTKIISLFFAFLFSTISLSQTKTENFNIDLISHVRIGHDCNDVWGFIDSSGTEYAAIGSRIGVHIYSLEDPSKPQLRYIAEGARSIWRDMKFYNGVLYATADQDTFGLTIIDVRKAPDTITHSQWKPIITIGNNTGRLLRAHNLYIDSLGFAYLAGHNISRRGVMIVDLKKDPINPEFVSVVDRFYSHDAYVQNDRLYSSELNNGFAIYDVSNKSKPVELGRASSSRNFTHNAWLSEDGKTLFTTDEVSGGTVDSYDVEDPSNIRFLDKIKTNPGTTRVIPHNTHIKNTFAITSWYTDGIVIKDISDPSEMTIVGIYDTYPQDSLLPAGGSLFFGCWGAYPYLPSGLILASDINNGLFVLKPNYQKAASISGKVQMILNGVDTISAGDANVSYIITERNQKITLSDSEYAFLVAPSKINGFEFSKNRFSPDTLFQFFSEDTSILFDYYFKGISSTVTAKNLNTLSFISGVNYQFSDEVSELPTFEGKGEGSVSEIITQEGKNEKLIAGKWGTNFIEIPLTMGLNEIDLIPSLEDPMIYNTGWTTENNSRTGKWELGKPFGVKDGDLEYIPNSDIIDDLGLGAWVTGNSKVNPLNDFVSGGDNILRTPYFDLSNSDLVVIKNHLWYYSPIDNVSGEGFSVQLVNNKGQKIVLDNITSKLIPWTNKEYTIEPGSIQFTDSMQLVYTVNSEASSFSVEAGLDNLKIEKQTTTNVDDVGLEKVYFFPNPTTDIVRLSENGPSFDKMQIFTLSGVKLSEVDNLKNNLIDLSNFPTGEYLIYLSNLTSKFITKIVKL
jgi:choice-of-anchor B domain-containing protein